MARMGSWECDMEADVGGLNIHRNPEHRMEHKRFSKRAGNVSDTQ
jgi:hypothetical protein